MSTDPKVNEEHSNENKEADQPHSNTTKSFSSGLKKNTLIPVCPVPIPNLHYHQQMDVRQESYQQIFSG